MTFLRWVIIGILFYLIYRVLRGLVSPEKPRESRGVGRRSVPAGNGDPEDLVQDPRCGVYMPRSQGVASLVEGRVLYFCSDKCRDEYMDKLRRN